MSYYNIEQTLEVFRKELPEPELPFDLPQLADLCRQGKLTPLFPYNGYVSIPVDYEPFFGYQATPIADDDTEGRPIHAKGAIDPYSGYLKSGKLMTLIDGYADSFELRTASTLQDNHDLLFYERPMRHIDDDLEPISFKVKLENIRFAIDEVKQYLASFYFDDLTTPEQQRIAELENQIADLESQLAQAKAEQADTPVNSAIDEGQGDTLLILGAVMDCIKDVAKPNYTQQSLITAITDKYKNTPSLSASTLSKKFPTAKKHLNQRVTS